MIPSALTEVLYFYIRAQVLNKKYLKDKNLLQLKHNLF